ncbi:hypothetical protein [Methylobacterium sp. 285MFTsu5.1]|uniref:hypothetical protein n=1 Tax=Methylobacterium sp. 285MFTsu5.1 TaxID=1172187 RepID=UPI000370C2E4|nr:hypothetical protein [Methylobacterium sp. 285MFTsu5.1]
MSDPVSAAFGAATLPPPTDEPKPLSRRRAKHSLTDEVTALAQSLGVTPVLVDGVPTYKPDGFVLAVKRVHDALLGVKDDLLARHEVLEKREAALEARELAIQAREERQAGFEALGELIAFKPASAPRRRFLGVF